MFCSRVSLWNLSYTWTRSTGATDTVKFKAVFSQGYGARASSSVEFRNTQVTCSTPLRAECQKHTNFFWSCLIFFPHIKYPILLTLMGFCGMASCFQNIRKHNAFAPFSFVPWSQNESTALLSSYFYALTVWMLPPPPCFCASWKLLPPLFWERSFRAWLRPLFKRCFWYQCFTFSFYTWLCCHLVLS